MSASDPNEVPQPPSPDASAPPSAAESQPAAAPEAATAPIEPNPHPESPTSIPTEQNPAEAAAGAESPERPTISSEAESDAPSAAVAAPMNSVPLDLPDFAPRAPSARNDQSIDLLNDVELNVKIELGRANMLIEDVLRLGEGAVVELDKLAGDPVDVLVNDRLVARGEVLVLNDNFCVRISEIIAGVEEEVAEVSAT